LESGLTRTLKAFDKETAAGDDADAAGLPKAKRKRAKAISKIDLTAACQLVLDASVGPPTNGVAATAAPAAEEVTKPQKRKREAEEVEVEAEQEAEPQKKRKKSAEAAAPASAPAEEVQPTEEVVKKKKKKDKEENQEEKERKSGVPFSRVDDSKWRATITDSRLLDNTHLAKERFGGSAGDSWAHAAAADMLKVKGKGFRKEMAKKKRASWRGGGEIDQGVNSIKFAASSDDE
jgi:hypothetical protein